MRPLPESICFADPSSLEIATSFLSDDPPDGALLVITGPKASGKTRLARCLLGPDVLPEYFPFRDEVSIGMRLASNPSKPILFDDARPLVRTGPNEDGKKWEDHPVVSPAIAASILNGRTIVLTGVKIFLCADLERIASRIRLITPNS